MSSSEEKIDVSYFRRNKEVASSMDEKGVILKDGKNCVEFLSERSEWNLRKGESYCYIFEEVKGCPSRISQSYSADLEREIFRIE